MNSRSHGNFDDYYCLTAQEFHLCRYLGGIFTRIPARASRISEGYCSGVSYQENIPHRGVLYHGRYSEIFN